MRMVRPILLTAMLTASISWVQAESRPMDNYRSIIDRNPFGLKPPPEIKPPATPPPTVEKPAEFYLTGISTVGYPKRPKRVYLMNKDNSKKDKDKYFTLTMNEKSGDLRLNEVDEKQRRVKITYQDKEMWLSMKDNGVPPPNGGAMPGMPGVPGMANPAFPGMVGQPGAVPSAIPLPSGGMPIANPNPQPTSYPSQNLNRRVPRSTSAGMMTPGGASGVPTATIPGPTVNFGNTPTVQQIPENAPPAAPPVDPAEQYLRLKLEESANARQGAVTPPIPTL
jgi:hypothetical protein